MLLEEIFLIIFFTSAITIAGNTPILYRFKKEICKELTELKIRLAVIEKEHEKEN